jgi:hypothetical protein
MDKDEKVIKFLPSGDLKKLLSPEPSYKKIPQWYRDLAKHVNTNNLEELNPVNDRGADGSNVSTKLCLPFQDAMTTGYMYLLEDDLIVELSTDGKPKLSWKTDIFLIDKRPHVDLAIPDDVHPIHFGVKMNWFYETPENYSLLMTMPLNRPDLPFWCPSGLVDSDIWGLPAFLPFFIKRNFQGIIPKGTPIVQMIPIKRESWNLEVDDSPESLEKHELLSENRRSHITAHYRKFAWRKKQYTKTGNNIEKDTKDD